MICECGAPATAQLRTQSGIEACCPRCAALDGHGHLEAELIRALIEGPHMIQELTEQTRADKAYVFRTLNKLIARGRVRKIQSDDYHSVDSVRDWFGRGRMVEETRVPMVSVYMLTNPMRQES